MHSNACDLGVLRMDKLIRGRELGENRLLAVTGTMAYPEISAAVKALGLEERVSVLAVENGFFGDSVTCSGLLTGMDISSAILDWRSLHHECEVVLIPSYAVFEDRFLDDMTVKELT
jgi:NifB/MoaA-like Fe-S oxidoreductase